MAPAAGESFLASARVIRAGRTLTVCTGEARAMHEGKESVIAVMQATAAFAGGGLALLDQYRQLAIDLIGHGRQYLAVCVGWGGWTAGFAGDGAPWLRNSRRGNTMFVFALPK